MGESHGRDSTAADGDVAMRTMQVIPMSSWINYSMHPNDDVMLARSAAGGMHERDDIGHL